MPGLIILRKIFLLLEVQFKLHVVLIVRIVV